MTQSKKEKIGIHMNPDLIKRIDTEYSLYGCTSRSDFLCKAAEFYLGFLHSQEDTEYMSKTMLSLIRRASRRRRTNGSSRKVPMRQSYRRRCGTRYIR